MTTNVEENEIKPLTRTEWMLSELEKDGFHLTNRGLHRILEGNTENFTGELIDYVSELEKEWPAD